MHHAGLLLVLYTLGFTFTQINFPSKKISLNYELPINHYCILNRTLYYHLIVNSSNKKIV